MSTKERLTVLGIALASSSVGFLAGVLTAPRSGRRTRRLLARRVEDERNDLVRRGRRAVSHTADSLGERFEEGRRTVAHAIGR
jgi:gas vesicle protein